MSGLQPLSLPTLADRTAELIRTRILDGALPGGERLVESKLAEQLHVSRGPVREALKQLATEGLVREVPRRGAFVAAPTEQDARDLYDLRVALEARAARLLIQRRDPRAITTLRRSLDRIRRAARAGDIRNLARFDYEFHATLCEMSGNARLHEVYVRNQWLLRLLIRLEEERFYESFEDVEAQHRELFESLEEGMAGRAEALIIEHLEGARDRLLAYYSDRASESEG